MTAHLTDELAQGLADGSLAGRVLSECEAHEAVCAECRALVESYRALGDALDGLDSPRAPPGFTDAVMDRIEAADGARVRERRLAIGIAAAAALLAAGSLGLAGVGAWALAVSRITGRLGGLASALSVGAEVVSPIVRALRVEIALACTAMVLPLLYALSRLAPRRAEAPA